ncbi:MAG TPA: phosphoribosyltransferase family protein [Acidimicrobiales bacterium]|nr:phosphoribosyltransferase family protein [Acidimicrobiales bacterium]
MTVRVLADADAVRARVRDLGAVITARHPHGAVLVAVLKGSVPFLADLARAVDAPITIDFLAVSAYRQGGGRVRLVKDLDADVGGRAVVLVQDVVDSGLTTGYLLDELRRRDPSSVDVCALVDRDARRILPVPLIGAGFQVGDDYVVGMGLDHRGRYRNLDLLAVVDEEALERDPDAYVTELYGRRSGLHRG